MKKSILIISYVFPPAPGIGGRRMAKFAKHLAKLGWDVHVLTANNVHNGDSQWAKDVTYENIKVHLSKTGYPEVLWTNPSTLIQKIRYRLALRFMKKSTKGNYYDRSALWGENLLKMSSELIKKYDIDNVLATGGPFQTLFHAGQIKKHHTNINLILDYRDQWVDNQSFAGFTTIGKERLAYEESLEQEALNQADHVITVAELMTTNVKGRSQNKNCQYHTILNGFDSDEVIGKSIKQGEGPLKLIFTGTLYDGLEQLLFPFFDTCKFLNETIDFEINFYGSAAKLYQQYVIDNDIACVSFNGKIPLREVHEKIADSHYCLLFLNNDHTFSMSTKFFEYVGACKRILVVSESGDLQKLVVEEDLGFALKPEDGFSELKTALETYNSLFSFDTSKFSTIENTNQLVKILQ